MDAQASASIMEQLDQIASGKNTDLEKLQEEGEPTAILAEVNRLMLAVDAISNTQLAGW